MHFSDIMPRTTICWMPREKTCVQFLLTSVIFTILLSVRSPMPPIYDLVQGLSSKRQLKEIVKLLNKKGQEE